MNLVTAGVETAIRVLESPDGQKVAQIAPWIGAATNAIGVYFAVLKYRDGHQMRQNHEQETLFRKCFGFLSTSDSTLGKHDPRHWGSASHYDTNALINLRNLIYTYIAQKEEVLPKPIKVNNNRNLCSIGGPVGNYYSRYGLGYDKAGIYCNTILPYHFDLHSAESNIKVWDPAHGEEGEPNWYVVDRNGKVVGEPKAKKGKGRFWLLETDVLLLTVAPNTFTKRAYDAGYRHLIVAGAHGPANKAIGKILNSYKILKAIEDKVFFQAIIEIPGLKVTDRDYDPKGEPSIVCIEELNSNDFNQFKKFSEWA